MKIIIHDLNEKEISKLSFNEDDYLINSLECKNSCIGCFSCWIKHPKICCYNDQFSHIPDLIKKASEFIIISKARYGCYSSSTKRVLERCIGYILPYFCVRNNMIHHETRYHNSLIFHPIFYGNLNTVDKECLYNLAKANSINLDATFKVDYCKNIKEIKKCIS